MDATCRVVGIGFFFFFFSTLFTYVKRSAWQLEHFYAWWKVGQLTDRGIYMFPSSGGSRLTWKLESANSMMQSSCARRQRKQTALHAVQWVYQCCNIIFTVHHKERGSELEGTSFPESSPANDSHCVCGVLSWVTVPTSTAEGGLPQTVVPVSAWQYEWYINRYL